ncbi:MAG: hypothetical protein GY697_16140 [Desulfobacterales bacterium]|nr:hypothetical protein [Desulfobacterales bacterium]
MKRLRVNLIEIVLMAIIATSCTSTSKQHTGTSTSIRKPPSGGPTAVSLSPEIKDNRMSFLVSRQLGVTSARQLDGATICVLPGTIMEMKTAEFFVEHGMRFSPVVVPSTPDLERAFFAGRCDGVADYYSDLVQMKASAGGQSDYRILPFIDAPSVSRQRTGQPNYSQQHTSTPVITSLNRPQNQTNKTQIKNSEYTRIEQNIAQIDRELAEVENQKNRDTVAYGRDYHNSYKRKDLGGFLKSAATKHLPRADAYKTKRRNLLAEKNRLKNRLKSTPMYINVASPSQRDMQGQNDLQTASFGSEAERNKKISENCQKQASRYDDGNGQTTPMCQQAIYNQCLADSLCGFYPEKCDKLRSRVSVSCDILSGMGDLACPPCN